MTKSPERNIFHNLRAAFVGSVSLLSTLGPSVQAACAEKAGQASRHYAPLTVLTHEADQRIVNHQILSAYAGSVVLIKKVFNESSKKFTTIKYGAMPHPILVFRGKDIRDNANNVTNGDYAFGYVEPNNPGQGVRLRTYNPNDMQLIKPKGVKPIIKFKFPPSSEGGIDLYHPETPSGKPLVDGFDNPESVGLLLLEENSYKTAAR